MNRDNFYFMIIFIPLSLIAIAGFMVDINWLNIAVTWLTGFILGVILYKLGLKALFYWLFQPVSRTYVIRKGRNYCYHGFKFFIKPRIKSIGVTFHESCKVETKGIISGAREFMGWFSTAGKFASVYAQDRSPILRH